MSFAESTLTRDGFLGGRLTILQPRTGYRAATDPVLLAAFAPARPGDAVLDLGCGVGTAGLCLARRVGGLDLHGLELQPDYADLARRNSAANALGMTVHVGDLRAPPAEIRERSFDQVLANPPFHPFGAATPAADPGRDTALREGEAGLADWIAAGLRRLRPGGRLVLIHLAERLGEALAALEGRAGGTEILPIVARAGRPAGRVLIRTHKNRAAPTTLLSPLIVHRGTSHIRDADDYTAEVAGVLREMHELLPNARLGGIEG